MKLSICGIIMTEKEGSAGRKTCSIATFSNTNTNHMGWLMIEHCFRREKQAANHLSHGTALMLISVSAPSL
jgi:hypothetical protein